KAEDLLAPIRATAATVMDTVGELRYREGAKIFMDPQEPGAWVERSAMLRELTEQTVDILRTSTVPMITELRPLGGAFGRPPVLPNAVPGRDAKWQVFSGAGAAAEEQLDAFIGELAPWAQDEIVPNLLSNRQGM